MFPLIAGLITGGASLLGNIFSSNTSAQNTQANIQAQQGSQQEAEAFNASQADINRSFQSDQAGIQRDWTEGMWQRQADYNWNSMANQQMFQQNMSNTAYQRSRADMVAAGLNPVLAANAGGASTPSGGSASVGAVSSGIPSGSSASISPQNMALSHNVSPLAGLGDVASKVLQSAISVKTFDKMSEEISNLQAQQAKIAAETETEKTRPDYVRSQSAVAGGEYERLRNLMPHFTQTGRTAKSLEVIPDWLRNSIDVGGYAGGKVSDTLAPLLSSAKSARSLFPSRSTSETTNSSTGHSTFNERWDNLWR